MTYGRDFCKYNNQKRLFVRGGAEDSVTDTWERVCETPCRGPTSRSERMPRSRGEPPTRFRDLQGSSLLRHAQPQPPVNLHAHIASTVGHFPLRPGCQSRVTTRQRPNRLYRPVLHGYKTHAASPSRGQPVDSARGRKILAADLCLPQPCRRPDLVRNRHVARLDQDCAEIRDREPYQRDHRDRKYEYGDPVLSRRQG